MSNKNIYNLFLFISTLTRGLVEVFSVIFLYKMGYSINNILLFLLIMYLWGIVVNIISFIIDYRIIFIISSLLYGSSYLYLSFMSTSIFNLIIFAILLSSGSYSYHAIRHYLAMETVDYNKGKNINLILTIMYLGLIFSNIIGVFLVNKLSIVINSIIILLFSVISIIPILKLNNIKKNKFKFKNISIDRNKIIFSILEQFKVILTEIQPLYVYIYIKNSMYYVGTFNIIINIASLIVLWHISKKIKCRYFKYINIILCLTLIFKLNFNNNLILLLIAFLEGIGIKIYEKFSLNNLYNFNSNNIRGYLMLEEIIFFISKSIIMFIFLVFIKDIKNILYICIIGIFISAFFLKD